MAQGLSTLNPSLSPTHLSIRRSRATSTCYTHHQVSLMVSHNTTSTLVPSLGLCIRPASAAGLSFGMRRERVPPLRRKKERRIQRINVFMKVKYYHSRYECQALELIVVSRLSDCMVAVIYPARLPLPSTRLVSRLSSQLKRITALWPVPNILLGDRGTCVCGEQLAQLA